MFNGNCCVAESKNTGPKRGDRRDRQLGISSVLLYVFSLILKSRTAVFVPGHLFMADAVILFLLLSGFHFGARIYNYSSETKLKAGASARRVVIIGAGDAGASVLKELLDTPRSGIIPVALVDDDPAKKGTLICGVPVAGTIANLSDVLFSYQGSEVLICIPSATQGQRHRILATCLKCSVPVRTLPCLADLLTDRASSRDLRAVSIEDALQRDRFVPDHSLATNLVGGKVVLVTGAGGSIGSELCKQIAVDDESEGRKLLAETRLEINGSKISIQVPEQSEHSLGTLLLVKAPKNATLNLSVHNGGVSLTNFIGTAEAHAENGGISFRRSTGKLTAEAQNGGISIKDCGGDVVARVKNGGLSIALPEHWEGKGLEAHAQNGGLVVSVPKTFSGGLALPRALGSGNASSTISNAATRPSSSNCRAAAGCSSPKWPRTVFPIISAPERPG